MYVPDNTTPGNIVNASPVNASVQGKVVDQSNNPVIGATVKSGSNMTTTDSRGLFRFNHINIDKYASVVTVEANGFFKGIRTFSAKEGSSNFVKLKLLTKNLVGSVDAAAGGTVTLPDNSQVIFSASSVVIKSTGTAYTGAVKVYAAKIDPTADDIAETVPGSFQADDINNFRVILKSFGMVAVLLEGSAGEQLQIATGKTAKLHVTIPASLVADAPASLPLWYMDETTGLWKQQGTATKTGNAYEGDVSHFSFWNCDAGANTIFFEVNINTVNGPLPNATVRLTRINNGGGFSYGITDSLGHVGGMVFMNEEMKLDVLNDCHEVVYTQNVGPFAVATNLGTLTVPVSPQTSLVLSGTVVDCSHQLVTAGTALIFFEGYAYMAPVVNGSFAANLLRCSNSTQSIEIIVTDNVNHQQSPVWTGTATTGTVNVDTLTACGIVLTNEYINYSMNGVPFSFTPPNASFFHNGNPQSNAIISALNSNNSDNCNMSFYNDSITLNSLQQMVSFQSNAIPLVPTGGATVNALITEYGAVGEYIAGSFSGTFITQQSPFVTYDVTCSFRVKRAY